MKSYILSLLALISVECFAQTKQDSVFNSVTFLNTYKIVEAKFNANEVGKFEYRFSTEGSTNQSKIVLENYRSKKDSSKIFSIITRFDYNEAGYLISRKSWKTNNTDKSCDCNIWYKKERNFLSVKIYHPRCKKIKLNCDATGKFATK